MPTTDARSLTRYVKTAIVHKVIDITPGLEESRSNVPITEGLAFIKKHVGLIVALGVVLVPGVIALMVFGHGSQKKAAVLAPAHPAIALAQAAPTAPKVVLPKAAPAAPMVLELNMTTAVQQGVIECLWRGNGKDRLVMDARNRSVHPLWVHLDAGQLLASDDSTVVVVKSQTLEFAPGAERHEEFATVATSAANKVGGAEFHLSAGTLPDMDKLLAYAAAHPDLKPVPMQTATLILTENLPLSAFAKFNEITAGAECIHESEDFKAETGDILAALTIIKEMGIERPLAVTIDPQLETEAMIDPAAHGMAVSYYGIRDEWGYWKHQLLEGDPSTRHYALYGIARYYPDVALQMLPKWARQGSMSPVYRMSAVQALALTGKAEAIPILRELEREFGGTSNLGHAAHVAANFLDEAVARGEKRTGLASVAE